MNWVPSAGRILKATPFCSTLRRGDTWHLVQDQEIRGEPVRNAHRHDILVVAGRESGYSGGGEGEAIMGRKAKK